MGGKAIEFPSSDSIHVKAGEPVEFKLVARDAAQLPAGTYLYRLSGSGSQLWRQMVLLP